jgi:hypothetical protein
MPVGHQPAYRAQLSNSIDGGRDFARCVRVGGARGIRIVAPIHDAFVAEAEAPDAEEVSIALDRVMRDASRVVLRGHELRTDMQPIIRAGGRFFDKRGLAMWTTVTELLAKLERETA